MQSIRSTFTKSTRTAQRQPRAGAFTLIESLVSVLIVSGVLVAALGTVGAIGKARHVQVERAAAVRLAERVMAEILQCYFQEPSGGTTSLGPDAGETSRALFDDVDDYNSWQMSPPTLRDGTAMPSYAGWKVKVRVNYVLLSDPASQTNSVTTLKRVRMVVETAGGAEYVFHGLRSASGAYEQLPSVTTTYLTYTSVTAQVSERGKTIYGGAHPLNVTTSP